MGAKELGGFVAGLINSLTEEMISYKEHSIDRKTELEKKKKIAVVEIKGAVDKRKLELETEIESMKTEKSAYLKEVKDRCDAEIRDYKQYLEAIDELKKMIEDKFTNMPRAMSLTIHHHAKKMLDEMRMSQDIYQRKVNEDNLIRLLMAIHEDSQGQNLQLPKETIKVITETQK